MEIKLYKEENRTIIVIEDGSIDLDKAVFALVNAAVTNVEGLDPPTKTQTPSPTPIPEHEMTSPPEAMTMEHAAEMLATDKEDALIHLLNVARTMQGDERKKVIALCKDFAKGLSEQIEQYSQADKIRLVRAGWKSQFTGKYGVLHGTAYASIQEFDENASDNEIDVAANAFAQMLSIWGSR